MALAQWRCAGRAHGAARLVSTQTDATERFHAGYTGLGVSHASCGKAAVQAGPKRLDRAAWAVAFVFEKGGQSATDPLFEVMGDRVGMKLQASGDKPMLGTLALHEEDQQIGAGHGLCPTHDPLGFMLILSREKAQKSSPPQKTLPHTPPYRV